MSWTLAATSRRQGSGAPEKNGLSDCGDLGRAHAFAHQCEGFISAAVRGAEVIGLVEIEIVDTGQVHKRGDGERLVAVGQDRGDFVRLDRHVFAFGHLIAFDLLLAVHGFARLRVDELTPNAVARRSIDRVEGDPLAGRSGGVKADGDSHVSDLQETFPACPRRQRRPREVLRAASAAD